MALKREMVKTIASDLDSLNDLDMPSNKFDKTLSSGGFPDLSSKITTPKKKSKRIVKKSKVHDDDCVFDKVTQAEKFYNDDKFNAVIASPLNPNKKLWLKSSQVACGMKRIVDLFPQFNILVRSPFIEYNEWSFSLNNLYLKDGNHVIKDNTFLF